MNKLTLEAAAGVYSGTAHDAKPHPLHIERNKAFKAGAAWQRNHVWHSNAEMPSCGMDGYGLGKACLFAKGENMLVGHASRSASGTYYFTDGSGIWHPVKSVKRWLYLDDIMPTSFDEIIEANKDVLQRLRDK